MIRLTAVIELDAQAPRALTHESSARTIIIGRDASADFQVPLSTISRQHSRITESDGVYFIEDLGSTHGTLVNGKKIGKGEKKVLRDGDFIELTKAKITCNIESDKLVSVEPGEGTQAIASRAVQGILGRLGDAQGLGPYLRVLNGPDEGVRFPFAGTLMEWALGRSKECEFILNDPNVSRRHAMIRKDWNGFVVHDLGSKNGVQVNDRSIKKARRLKDRDEITVGPVKLVYIDPDAELLESLKDVPGFEIDDSSEVEAVDGEPSHIGAPGMDENDGSAGEGENLGPPRDDESGSAEPGPEALEDEINVYANIDPALLEEAHGGKGVEWVVIGVVAVVIMFAVAAIFVLV
ncbi:MAG: FHA domain-containing protein [Myxococcota bacterium]